MSAAGETQAKHPFVRHVASPAVCRTCGYPSSMAWHEAADAPSPTPVIGGREEIEEAAAKVCSEHDTLDGNNCALTGECCGCQYTYPGGCEYHTHFGCDAEIDRLMAENARLEAERDEAVEDFARMLNVKLDLVQDNLHNYRRALAAESRLSALTTENEGLRGQFSALVSALEEMRGAVLNVIEEVNIEHVAAAGPDGDAEDCPADDTCRCPHICRLEAALKLADSALSSARERGEK